jgi:cytoskeletal protein CcmA (bactofilin family)
MSDKEIEDLKTLIKSLDIRLRNDEISKEEYNSLKAKYEARLQEEIALVKEKSFLKDLSYVSISGSGKVTNSYISISGSGKIDGWHGGTIDISGSGKVTDDEIKVSGSATLPGDLKTHTVKASGSLKANGPIESNIFVCSGSCIVDGSLIAHEKMAISGSAKINGPILGGLVASNGALKVDGSIKCREAELNGAYNIKNNVECQESFSSELDSKCSIDGDLICGGDVYIEMTKGKGRLNVNQIISQGEVQLEGVTAEYVSGKTVKLGPDCKIGMVEEISN